MNPELLVLGLFAAIILWLMAFSYELGKKKGLKAGKSEAYDTMHKRLDRLSKLVK